MATSTRFTTESTVTPIPQSPDQNKSHLPVLRNYEWIYVSLNESNTPPDGSGISYVIICPLIQAMLPYTVVNIKGQLKQEPATWFLIKQMAVQFPLCS